MNDLSKKSSRGIMRQFGTSYFWASLLLPKAIQYETLELYRFLRIPDQIVDDPNFNISQKEKGFSDLHNHRKNIYEQENFDDEKMGKRLRIVKSKHISNIYIDAFWESMHMDLVKNRYETYEELKLYMYGSAEVVGLMMCDIIGYNADYTEQTIVGARKLGEAMQLTNFLRDVYEDYVDLGRIYLPLEDLKKFGLSYDDVAIFCESKKVDHRWVDFMKYMSARCDDLYEQADQTIKYLSKDSQSAVYLSSRFYKAILHKLDSINYNQFAKFAKTTRRDKFKVFGKFQIRQNYSNIFG